MAPIWNRRKFMTASGVVTTRPAELIGWTARVSEDSVVQVYKGTSVGSDEDILSELDVLGSDKSGGVMSINVGGSTGLYLAITGTARVCVYYHEKP